LLFALPAELLNRVLKYCVAKQDPIEADLCVIDGRESQGYLIYKQSIADFYDVLIAPYAYKPSSILSVCRLLRNLAVPMFGNLNTLHFTPFSKPVSDKVTKTYSRLLGQIAHCLRDVAMDVETRYFNQPGSPGAAAWIRVSARISTEGALIVEKNDHRRALLRRNGSI
jgi:hypothetical protein